MPDRELADRRLVCSTSGEFPNFGTRTIGAKDNRCRYHCAIAEGRDDAFAAFVECYIGKFLAILVEQICNRQSGSKFLDFGEPESNVRSLRNFFRPFFLC